MDHAEYDIIFWAHGHNETERFLPLIVSLKERGIKTLLFYQNYDFRDGLSCVQQKIVGRYGLDILDYSYFLRNDPLLRLTTLFVKMFSRALKVKFLYDKFRGLRTKLLRPRITEKFIRKIILGFGQRISFFDNLYLTEYTDYPYGSYYIKKISDESGIKCLSITHGGSVYIGKVKNCKEVFVHFDKIYVPNSYEKESFEEQRRYPGATEVLPLGDPRFDIKWKSSIKELFSEEVRKKIEKMRFKNGLKILYLAPNIEARGKGTSDATKYQSLREIAKICSSSGNISLLIKPHPRYRNEGKIRKVMAKAGLRDFFILEDDPLISYLDYVDYIISPGTSALGDILPEGHRKIIILDTFFPPAGVENIFKEHFTYFDSYEGVDDFLRGKIAGNRDMENETDKILLFCRKWIAADKRLDAIINNLTDDICNEVVKSQDGRHGRENDERV